MSYDRQREIESKSKLKIQIVHPAVWSGAASFDWGSVVPGYKQYSIIYKTIVNLEVLRDERDFLDWFSGHWNVFKTSLRTHWGSIISFEVADKDYLRNVRPAPLTTIGPISEEKSFAECSKGIRTYISENWECRMAEYCTNLELIASTGLNHIGLVDSYREKWNQQDKLLQYPKHWENLLLNHYLHTARNSVDIGDYQRAAEYSRMVFGMLSKPFFRAGETSSGSWSETMHDFMTRYPFLFELQKINEARVENKVNS